MMQAAKTSQSRFPTWPARRHRRAFTIIELMVVILIIAVLLGLLGVAFSGVMGSSRNAATSSLMHNIQTGVQQFTTDFGYLPPLIDGHKQALDSIDDPIQFADALRDHRYHSVYTLPLYLLGVGELSPLTSSTQTLDPNRHDGKQGPGFRDPGPDHSWGGARVRSRDTHRPKLTGRVYGPYIDIGDGEDVLRRAVLDDFDVPSSGEIEDFFADDDIDEVGDLFVFQDRWGQAIRYYKLWPTRTKINNVISPSLDQIPIELRTIESITQALYLPGADVDSDPLLDQDLIRAPYALLSAGADSVFGGADANGDWLNVVDLLTETTNDNGDMVQNISEFFKRIEDNIRTTP